MMYKNFRNIRRFILGTNMVNFLLSTPISFNKKFGEKVYIFVRNFVMTLLSGNRRETRNIG